MATFKHRSKDRPINPPTIFPSQSGEFPQEPSPTKRETKRVLTSVRSIKPDELGDFQKKDEINIDQVPATMSSNDNVITYQLGDCFVIQSRDIEHGIPRYMVQLGRDLSFKTFHLGSEVTISTLSKNNIRKCKSWSILDEILRYLRHMPVEDKKKNALEQLELLGPKKVGQPHYSPETMVRAFEHFATSRALYNRIARDHKYPSARTLTRITSKVSKKDDATYLNDVLSK